MGRDSPPDELEAHQEARVGRASFSMRLVAKRVVPIRNVPLSRLGLALTWHLNCALIRRLEGPDSREGCRPWFIREQAHTELTGTTCIDHRHPRPPPLVPPEEQPDNPPDWEKDQDRCTCAVAHPDNNNGSQRCYQQVDT